jgi:hypothetical protein
MLSPVLNWSFVSAAISVLAVVSALTAITAGIFMKLYQISEGDSIMKESQYGDTVTRIIHRMFFRIVLTLLALEAMNWIVFFIVKFWRTAIG